jgi:hypothetical protein
MVQASLIALLLAVAASVGHALKAPTDPYPVGSTFVAKQEPSNENHERQLDIANNKKYGPHPVLLNPIAINIYYGAAWTQAQRDLMDLFTANLGSTPYYTTVQTLKDPSGATAAPLTFGGSFFDNVVDSKVTFGADSTKQIQNILQGYIDAKSIGGTAIDITNTDFKNTIFNLVRCTTHFPPLAHISSHLPPSTPLPSFFQVTSPQVKFAVTGTCGYHSVMTLSSNPANPATTNDLKVYYSISASSVCNPFSGGYTNGQGGNALISKKAPNDAAVDAVLKVLTHELLETISDPQVPSFLLSFLLSFSNLLTVVLPSLTPQPYQSWWNNDDGRYST